jgi:hypothetical protein
MALFSHGCGSCAANVASVRHSYILLNIVVSLCTPKSKYMMEKVIHLLRLALGGDRTSALDTDEDSNRYIL